MPTVLRSQSSASAIKILGIDHSGTNVSIHWEGGFPPYRLQAKRDLAADWSEYPDFIQGTSFNEAAELGFRFFQVRTEYAPIRLTRIQNYGDLVYLNWTGGTPPYRVQASTLTDSDWKDLPHLVYDDFYASFAGGDHSLYRVRSEPDTNAPSSPANLSALLIQCEKAVLSWSTASDDSAGSGIIAYNLYRNGRLVKQIDALTIFALDTELRPRTFYEYSISSVDRSGNESPRSESLEITTVECPEGETNGTGDTSSLVIEWDRSEASSTAGYIVYWGFQPGVYPWQKDVMQSTTATIDGLASGVPYFISVTAYDFSGAESEPSSKLTHIPP